jgi:hypothetical protein
MSLRILSKVAFLLLALAATVYAVFQLNTGHMNDFWTSLGMGKNSQSLNWCNDRLVSLSGTHNTVEWTLKEHDAKWIIVKNNDTKTLEYLDIEKWLAKYCILDIKTEKNESFLDMAVTPIAFAEFNDKSTARIFTLGNNGLFQINTVIFTSPEFEQALVELRALLKL